MDIFLEKAGEGSAGETVFIPSKQERLEKSATAATYTHAR